MEKQLGNAGKGKQISILFYSGTSVFTQVLDQCQFDSVDAVVSRCEPVLAAIPPNHKREAYVIIKDSISDTVTRDDLMTVSRTWHHQKRQTLISYVRERLLYWETMQKRSAVRREETSVAA